MKTTQAHAQKPPQLENRHDLPESANAYWRANLKVIGILLSVWFAVSFGCGILLADLLNKYTLFGFKLGFWWAQQGAIYVFVLLIFVYIFWMQRLDRRFGVSDDDAAGS
jgi:putative solute:sodium symporter small subunit